jgi:hypothetical protein
MSKRRGWIGPAQGRRDEQGHHPKVRTAFRPLGIALEPRCLLSTFTWDINGDGDFNVAANWVNQDNQHGVPGPGDTAIINYGGITVSVNQSDAVDNLQSGAILKINGGTFAVADLVQNTAISSLILGPGATFEVDGGAASIGGSGTFAGTFSAAPEATIDFAAGTQQIDGGALFDGSGQYMVGGATWVVNAAITAPTNFAFDGGSFENGDLDVLGSFSLPGTFTWAGGILGGTGTTLVESGATVHITGSREKNLGDRATLENEGTAVWDGSGSITGGTIDNVGTFTALTNDDINGLVFDNRGTFIKAIGDGYGVGTTTFSEGNLNNYGTVDVRDGTLSLYTTGDQDSGTFNVAAYATIGFDGNDQTLNGGTILEGAGVYRVTGSTLRIDTDVSPENVDMLGGTIDGDFTLTATTFFGWFGGDLDGGGTTVIAPGATMGIEGADSKTLSNNHVLDIEGTAIRTGGAIQGSSASTINNSGMFIDETGSVIAGEVFNNSGTFTEANGTGTTYFFASYLSSTGAIDVQSGTLEFAAAQIFGTVDVEPRGTLLFAGAVGAGSAVQVAPGAVFGGAGQYLLDDGFTTLEIDADLTFANFTFEGGNLTGAGSLTITGKFDWAGGNINGPAGGIAVPSGGIANISGPSKSLSTTLDLGGQTTWSGGGTIGIGFGGLIDNLASGTFTIENDEAYSGPFINAGTLIKVFDPTTDSGDATTTIGYAAFSTRLDNTGTIDIESGTLEVDGLVSQFSGGTLAAGTWSVSGASAAPAAIVFHDLPAITGIGPAAAVTLDGTGASFSNLAGLASNAGRFSLQGGQSFATPGGFTNSGKLSIGAASSLQVAGSFAAAPGATLCVAIAGTPSSGQFGQIVATGSATLAGTLNVSATVSSPGIGVSYEVVTDSGQSGTFSPINGLALPGGVVLQPVYNPTNFTLTTAAAGVPTDVTSQVTIHYGGFRVNHATGLVSQTLVLTNNGTTPIMGPISLVLDDLTSGVTLTNATGTTAATSPAGSPYINLPLGTAGVLAPGQSVVIVLQFLDPDLVPINYTSRVLAGPGTR